MNLGMNRPKVLLFCKDAVPSASELEALRGAPAYLNLMARNGSAILPGDKPEACDYVIGENIPEPYANVPVFDKSADKEIRAMQARDAKDNAADELELRKQGERNGIVLPPARDDDRPLGLSSQPDLDALHGTGEPTVSPKERLGGFPAPHEAPAPGTVTTRAPDASNPGTAGLPAAGEPATPAPDANPGTGKGTPAKSAGSPATNWGKN